jgi:hypothetical protein
MRKLIAIVFSCLLLNTMAYAGSSCQAQATEKKLSGAVKNSFVKKCQKDAAAAANTACESQAAEKKLAGAAKSSFVKKCEKDAAAAR